MVIFKIGGGGWGNSELQYYTNRIENAKVENGILKITARYEPNYLGTGYNYYTSARMRTKDKAYWKYVRVEARMKVPFCYRNMACILDASQYRKLASCRRN